AQGRPAVVVHDRAARARGRAARDAGDPAALRHGPAAGALPRQDGHVHPALRLPGTATRLGHRRTRPRDRLRQRLGPGMVGSGAVLARGTPLPATVFRRHPRAPGGGDMNLDPERQTGPRTFQVDFLTALFRDPLDPAYAQAAEAAKRRGKLPFWNRATRKVTTWIALAAIGLLLAIAYQQVIRSTPEREKVRAGLITRI